MTISRVSLVSPLSRVAKMAMLSTCGVSALMVAGVAHAQTAAPAAQADASDGIVVTGFRASLKSALDAKRKDTRVSDGISSEDIGKFPAENITDRSSAFPASRCRTSTVAAQRSAFAALAPICDDHHQWSDHQERRLHRRLPL
jgi:hypothetical protein